MLSEERVKTNIHSFLLTKLTRNVKSLRINRNEISGSLGDMGTFIPLLVGMVSVKY